METGQEAEEKWRNHWLNEKRKKIERGDQLWEKEGKDMDEETAVSNGVCSYESPVYRVGA